MGTALLELWEALGESLGVLVIGLMFSAVFWAWRREVQRLENDRRAREKQAERDRAESRERDERLRAEAREWDERDRAESKEQYERLRAETKEQYERLERAYARLASAVAVLQGDMKVLLDRSNRPSGGEPSSQPSPFDGVAHQALPDQCEDDAKTSSDEPVAPVPRDSAAEDPAD